jgi:hypothetical protein
MPTYLVHRRLPGISTDSLTSAGLRAKSCSAEMSAEGEPVRWITSYFLPQTEQTHCYFEAERKEAVAEVNRRANIPFEEIIEVQVLTPEKV